MGEILSHFIKQSIHCPDITIQSINGYGEHALMSLYVSIRTTFCWLFYNISMIIRIWFIIIKIHLDHIIPFHQNNMDHSRINQIIYQSHVLNNQDKSESKVSDRTRTDICICIILYMKLQVEKQFSSGHWRKQLNKYHETFNYIKVMNLEGSLNCFSTYNVIRLTEKCVSTNLMCGFHLGNIETFVTKTTAISCHG